MSAASPVLPSANVEGHIRDEEKATEAGSEANTMVEKNENDAEEPGQALESEEELSPEEYPKGFQFVFILLALILSIFMVALDLVCLAPDFAQAYAKLACRQSSRRLSQRSQMIFTAFPRLDGTAQPSS